MRFLVLVVSVFIPTTAHSIGQHFRVISAVRTKHGQGACCKMGDPSRVLISQEDADGTYITRNDGSMIELETALRGILHIREDSLEGVQNHASILDSDDKVYPVLNVHQKSDYGTKTHGNLTKSATFPSLGKTLSYALNGASLFGRSSQIYDNPSCVRSSSMPNPTKLVSAMKGGRGQQQGTPRLVKLNVSWAPDVYDPPTTSLSHTVKSQRQRHKTTKKKDQKHKYRGKSKSPRGSYSERKYHHVNHRRNIGVGTTNFMQLRSEEFVNKSPQLDFLDEPITEDRLSIASSARPLPLDGFDKQSEVMPSMKIAELAVGGGQDSKCGSSFRASLAKVHVSIAEAT
ncbi:hypothetical protein AAC387_Pa09g1710 [Persea americana]